MFILLFLVKNHDTLGDSAACAAGMMVSRNFAKKKPPRHCCFQCILFNEFGRFTNRYKASPYGNSIFHGIDEENNRKADSGHDELAMLANSFNRMTFELKRMMTSREELLLGVSHELRTPLTRARLAIEMLPYNDRKLQLCEDFREMSLLVDELLEFGRLRAGLKLDAELFSVGEVLRWSQEIAGALPEFQSENGVIAVEGLGEILEMSLKVDRLRVVRIIRNLIKNAARSCSHAIHQREPNSD